jgi:alpha-L-fucosidase 2
MTKARFAWIPRNHSKHWDVVNPLPEIAGLRYVLPRLLTLPAEESLKRQWRHLLNDLPPIPSRTVDGKSFLLPAAQFSNTQNCENPELYAVFPYRLYTVSGPFEMQEIGRETWLRRLHSGTGGWQQNAIQAAMLGLDDEAKAAVVANAHSNSKGFRFPATWGPNYDWIPDQCHGNVTMIALQRMLLQCEGDRMLLLPAWPQTWDAEFKLHAPYQTTVEGVIRDGKLIEYKVTPESRKNNLTVFERPKVSP